MDVGALIQLLTGAGIVAGLYLNLRKSRNEEHALLRADLRDDYERVKGERDELLRRDTGCDRTEAALSFLIASLSITHPAIVQQALAISRGELDADDRPPRVGSDPKLRTIRKRDEG